MNSRLQGIAVAMLVVVSSPVEAASQATLTIDTIPSGAKFIAYSSNDVLFKGTTPSIQAVSTTGIERICFEKEGYDTFWKTMRGENAITVTLRPLTSTQSRPSSRCFTSGSQIISDKKVEAEEAERIAKKKRDDELYWKRVEEAKAAKAKSEAAAAVARRSRSSIASQDQSGRSSIASQGQTRRPVVGSDGTLLIPSGSGYIVPQTGQYVPPGGTYRSPNPVVSPNGTVYVPSGPNGYVNTRTGQFVPVP